MPTVSEKLKNESVVTPHEIMETDHGNINLSRDAFELKYRKKAEIKAKLALEKLRLEEEEEKEYQELQKVEAEDNAENEKTQEE